MTEQSDPNSSMPEHPGPENPGPENPGPENPAPREKLGRPPRFVVLIASLAVLVVLGWSGIWYAGTRKADEMATAWLAAEAAKGRTYQCDERDLGGYPFRVEVICIAPRLDIADAEPQLQLTAQEFRAVVQVWNLTHVIFEIDGPVRIEGGERSGKPEIAVDADWELLQGSVRAPGGQLAKLDIAIGKLIASPDAATLGPGGGATVSARQIGIHGKSGITAAGANAAAGRDIQVAFDAKGLIVALPDMTLPEAVDINFVGQLGALPNPPPREPRAFLNAWRDNDGNIAVERLSATQGDSEIRVVGKFAPDSFGRPEGAVSVSIAGPDLNTPGAAGAFGGLAPIIALALRLTGKPGEIDGRTALSGEIEFRDGVVYLGAMPITEIPRLF